MKSGRRDQALNRFALLGAFLGMALSSPAPGQERPTPQGPACELGFGKDGLQSLRFGGQEFLSDGRVRIDAVHFHGDGGKSIRSEAGPGTVTVDPGQRTVTWTYGWG